MVYPVAPVAQQPVVVVHAADFAGARVDTQRRVLGGLFLDPSSLLLLSLGLSRGLRLSLRLGLRLSLHPRLSLGLRDRLSLGLRGGFSLGFGFGYGTSLGFSFGFSLGARFGGGLLPLTLRGEHQRVRPS